MLPATEVVRLSARRWDIELALRLLQDHLRLNLLWSAKWERIGAQIWACLTLAQLFHALQMKAAEQEGVDPFDVSLHLLVRHVPRWLAQAPVVFPSSPKSPAKTSVGLPLICLCNVPLAILIALRGIVPAKSLLPDLFGVGDPSLRLRVTR